MWSKQTTPDTGAVENDSLLPQCDLQPEKDHYRSCKKISDKLSNHGSSLFKQNVILNCLSVKVGASIISEGIKDLGTAENLSHIDKFWCVSSYQAFRYRRKMDLY